MKRLKVLNLILGGLLVGSYFGGYISTPIASAEGQHQGRTTIREILQSNQERRDPYTVITEVSSNSTETSYTAEIGLLPKTLEDNKTLINCEWIENTGIDGVTYLETGDNLYYAKVTGSRVTTEFEGKQSAWSPKIYIGEKELPLTSGPTIVDDPYNTNYTGNTIKWVYSERRGGFLGIGAHTQTITRYLRQIEGILQEFYVLNSDPGGNLRIDNWYNKESGYTWASEVYAYDADYQDIPIVGGPEGKEIDKKDLKGAKYPVTVDPANSFTSSSQDGFTWYSGSNTDPWSTVRAYPTAAGTLAGMTVSYCGDSYENPWYSTWRSFLYFSTSSIGEGSTVTSASLAVRVQSSINYGIIYISGGMPTYPHSPLVVGDHNYTYYSGSYGTFANTVGWKTVYLNPAGVSAISKTGTTKFILWGDDSYSGSTPTYNKWAVIYTSEQGSDYAPYLVVNYAIPVVAPTMYTSAATSIDETSAVLNGGVTSDGNADVAGRFDYGTTTGYGYSTSWQGGLRTGSTYSGTVNGLLQGTLYYFESEGSNSAGSSTIPSTGVKTFLTKPSTPSILTITPGNTNNSISWTKGTGSTKTLVRFKTTGYPTSITDGTEVYSSTGTSVVHSSLTNGIPYYYSAWAIAEGGGLTQYSTTSIQSSGTPLLLGAPSVTTYSATNVSQTGALLHGSLVSYQGTATADVWFQYYTGAGTWTDHETTPDTMTSPALGAFSKSISGLTANTSYHCRAAAVNSQGTTYGSDIPFVTGSPSAPTMSIVYTGVTKTSAVLSGYVVDDGGAPVTVWFEWGYSPSYGNVEGYGTGYTTSTEPAIVNTLADLPVGTTIYCRVVGDSGSGRIGYSATSFATTSPTAPTITTQEASTPGSSFATLRGLVTGDGGVGCSVRFAWGLNTSYGNYTSWETGKLENEVVSTLLTGLSTGETYHYRAVVNNSAGEAYGADKYFTTIFNAPEDFSAIATGPTTIAVKWSLAGDQVGVFAKEGSFPVDRLDGEQIYFGPSTGVSHSSLAPGSTYFYRAWAWSEGGSWSSSYSEDAATTPYTVAEVSPEGVSLGTLSMPAEYFQTANGSALSNWPGYDLVTQAASDSGIPAGSLWLIIGLVICAAVGIVVWSISSSMILVMIAMAVVIAIMSIMGLVPFWMVTVYLVLALCGGFLLKQSA